MSAELREALNAVGASALVPKIIDPMLLEYQRRYSPLTRAIPSRKWGSDTYYFNQRTVNPAGGFVADGGARPVTNSTYVQNSFQMRHLQNVGAVTGYAQSVTQDVIGDLRAKEIEGAIKGLYWDIETALLWGSAGATQYGPYGQFDGFDQLVSTYSGSNQNAMDGTAGTGNLSLGVLDELADMVETNSAMSVFDSSWMFVMSNTAVSKVAQLLTNQQRFVDQVEVAAGLNVPTYRGIPLMKSSFLSTRSTSMGAVTATGATTGGTLAAGTYSYRVSAVVSRQGETVASTAVSVTTTGATSTAALAFTPPTGLDGLSPQLYKVYRGAAGSETLLGVVDAVVGLASDGITPIVANTILDDGGKLVPQYVSGSTTSPAQTPATYVGTNASKKPLAAGQENLFLVSRDEDNIVRPYVRELEPLDVFPTTSSPDSMPFAIVSDTVLALRGAKFIGGVFGVNTKLTA